MAGKKKLTRAPLKKLESGSKTGKAALPPGPGNAGVGQPRKYWLKLKGPRPYNAGNTSRPEPLIKSTQGVEPQRISKKSSSSHKSSSASTGQSDDVNDSDSEPYSYDVDSDVDIIGDASNRDVAQWDAPAADFIRSAAGINDDVDGQWFGKRPLGQGTFGIAGLWEKRDGNGTVVDEMVIKQLLPRKDRWYPGPEMPEEVKILKELNKANCRAVVHLFDYKRYPKHQTHRLYLEFCPHGDLRRLWKRYRRFRRHLPEPFLWDVFYYLAESVAVMKTRPNEEDWNLEVVHRDIKPQNIFLGAENTDDGTPFYPTPKMGDFGLAVRTNSKDPKERNPGSFLGSGTWGYKAPEQYSSSIRREVIDRLTEAVVVKNRPRLLAHTNIWAIGATMYELLTLHRLGKSIGGKYPDRKVGDPFMTKYGYSPALSKFIRDCLQLQPKDRPPIETIQLTINTHRRIIAEHDHDKRGKDTRAPTKEERVYYRGNEIEEMEVGDFVLDAGEVRDTDGPETGFPDPEVASIKFPWLDPRVDPGGERNPVVLSDGKENKPGERDHPGTGGENDEEAGADAGEGNEDEGDNDGGADDGEADAGEGNEDEGDNDGGADDGEADNGGADDEGTGDGGNVDGGQSNPIIISSSEESSPH